MNEIDYVLADRVRLAAYRAAREWCRIHRQAYPDDRMIDRAIGAALLAMYDNQRREAGS